MTDDEIALWLITKGTMEDKPVMSLAADRILTLRAERDRLREALDGLEIAATGAGVPHPLERKLLHEAIADARAALKGESRE